VANEDGDVDMVDASEPTAPEATIVKNEEAEAQAAMPAEETKAPATEVLPAPPADAGVVSAETAVKQSNGDDAAQDKPAAAVDGDKMDTDDAVQVAEAEKEPKASAEVEVEVKSQAHKD
jgi:hypothetical protein